MPKSLQNNIISELNKLAEELVDAIHHQLLYLSVSAYKQETITEMRAQIEALREVMSLFSDNLALESFADHDAELENPIALPDECSFTGRTARLLNATKVWLQDHRLSIHSQTLPDQDIHAIIEKGPFLAKLCSHGSKSHAFFRSL